MKYFCLLKVQSVIFTGFLHKVADVAGFFRGFFVAVNESCSLYTWFNSSKMFRGSPEFMRLSAHVHTMWCKQNRKLVLGGKMNTCQYEF